MSASPLYWEDPPWGDYESQWDWRCFISIDTQIDWLNLTDEQRWEIAVAAQRLSELQQRIVASLYP